MSLAFQVPQSRRWDCVSSDDEDEVSQFALVARQRGPIKTLQQNKLTVFQPHAALPQTAPLDDESTRCGSTLLTKSVSSSSEARQYDPLENLRSPELVGKSGTPPPLSPEDESDPDMAWPDSDDDNMLLGSSTAADKAREEQRAKELQVEQARDEAKRRALAALMAAPTPAEDLQMLCWPATEDEREAATSQRTTLKRALNQSSAQTQGTVTRQPALDAATRDATLEGLYSPEQLKLRSEDMAITERTTVVLRNVPNKYTQQGLLDLFEANGFTKDTLDFVYMPMDFRNKINLGYCFINFVSHADADGFMARFEKFNQWGSNSTKMAEVQWCQVQGLAAHIDRWRNSAVMHASVPDEFKPSLWREGVRVSFPIALDDLEAPKFRRYKRKVNQRKC